MKNKIIFASLMLILISNLLAKKPAHSVRSPKGITMKIGVLANRGKEECMNEWSATADYLTDKIQDCKFKIIPLGFEDVHPSVEEHKIDFLIVNPLYYTHLVRYHNMAPLLTMIKSKIKGVELSEFGGVLFCRSDNYDIVTASDLKNKKIIAVNNKSFGGWYTAWRELKRKGIDPLEYFKSLEFAGTQYKVVFKIRDGKADAGIIRTGILEKLDKTGTINLKDFRVIRLYEDQSNAKFPLRLSTRLYPEWPILYMKQENLDISKNVESLLIDMLPKSIPAKKAGIYGWTVPLNYNSVKECIKELGFDPLASKDKIPFAFMIKNLFFFYRGWFIIGSIVLIFLLGALILFVFLNHKLSISKRTLKAELELRKKMKKTLNANEEKFKMFFNLTFEGILIHQDGIALDVNMALIKLSGYEREELIGKNLIKLLILEKYHSFISEKMQNNYVKPYEVEGIRKDGTIFPVEIEARNYSDKEGISFRIASIKDITERKKAEYKIKKQNEFLHSIFEAVSNPLYVIDANNYTIKMANSATGIKIFDTEETSANDINNLDVDKNITCYKLTHKSDSSCSGEHICPLGEVKRTGKSVVVEHIHYDADGNPINIEIYGFPIFDDNGNVIQMVEYSFDITERKKMALELLLAKEAAEAANIAKSTFLANISHELRTPMTAILGLSKLFSKPDSGITDPEIREGLSIINKSGERLLKLINGILDFSKVNAGQMEINIEEFVLADFLKQIETMIDSLIGKKKIEFIINKEKNVPNIIKSDEEKINQVLINILDNSVKFTEKGKIVLNIFLKAERLFFEISDTGIGISTKHINIIFNEFMQIDGSSTRQYGGTGLGLTLSKKLVELLGGEIAVESELGVGTIVKFWIPQK